jgi:hypothetical protein
MISKIIWWAGKLFKVVDKIKKTRKNLKKIKETQKKKLKVH